MRRASLADRNISILHSIVETYIETGEPVASRTIAKRLREDLSPASIRNVMADLYEEGYLAQPHTSAGRIPTEKAFRSYIESLSGYRTARTELEGLRSQFAGVDTIQARVERTSHVLMELTRGFCIAAAIPTSSQVLDQVDLLPLADRRVLIVLVTRDRMVHNKVIGLSESIPGEELHEIRNYINRNFSGWALSKVHSEIERRLEAESAAFDAILRRLNLLYERGMLDVGLAPEVHMEGVSNLIGLDLHLTREKMRELFRALEQKKKMLHLLDLFLEESDGEVGVRVGLGDVHPAMEEFSLIGIAVTLPGGISGRLAVMGPMRMNYSQVMSAVFHVGRAFQQSEPV